MSDLVADQRGARPGAGAMVPPPQPEGYAELRALKVFEGVPDGDLLAALASGSVSRRALRRDVFVAEPGGQVGDVNRIFFVLEGQVAVAVFEPQALAARRAEQIRYEQMSEAERQELSLLPPPPLARVAKKNLATFMPGDLFNSAALPSGPDVELAFYTVRPSVVIAVEHAAIADLAVRFSEFETRVRRAIQASGERLKNVTGVKQEILDFFIRHGISVSGEKVRVRQLDRCIDCKQCEQACEQRYGSRRLTLGGFQLGMLDFVYTCRTCADQRCVDPCEYDSIKFDEKRGEVVINEASCVGCTLCAQSCPYGAIEMVEVEDAHNPTYRENFKKRLDKGGKLAFGPGKPRVARPRRIANKCDHCMTYRDQACVSACPTGALIEIHAYDLFHERSSRLAEVARQGYAKDPPRDRREVLPTEPFTKGIGIADAGLAKVKRGRLGPVLMWGLGLGAFLLTLTEIMLRLRAPQLSVQYMLLRHAGMGPGAALLKVGYRSGCRLAVLCGYVGTALMLVAIFYPMLRRVRLFRKIASNTMWFDFHMMAGTVGPLFILLHCALKLNNWVAIAFWSMVIVVISGVVGRYLYTQVPDLLNGRELEELDHARALAAFRRQHPDAMRAVDAELRSHSRRSTHIAEHAGLLRSFLWILAEDLRRPIRYLRRRMLVRRYRLSRRDRRELASRMGRVMLIDRRRVLVPRAQLLLQSWKKVHVPFSIILAAIATVHIYIAFVYSM